jgi:hypothetical protein
MRIDLDEMDRAARKRLAISADVDLNDDDRTVALIARIRELETLSNEALNRLATATVALKAERVIDSAEAAAEVAWIRDRHAVISKGTCTP